MKFPHYVIKQILEYVDDFKTFVNMCVVFHENMDKNLVILYYHNTIDTELLFCRSAGGDLIHDISYIISNNRPSMSSYLAENPDLGCNAGRHCALINNGEANASKLLPAIDSDNECDLTELSSDDGEHEFKRTYCESCAETIKNQYQDEWDDGYDLALDMTPIIPQRAIIDACLQLKIVPNFILPYKCCFYCSISDENEYVNSVGVRISGHKLCETIDNYIETITENFMQSNKELCKACGQIGHTKYDKTCAFEHTKNLSISLRTHYEQLRCIRLEEAARTQHNLFVQQVRDQFLAFVKENPNTCYKCKRQAIVCADLHLCDNCDCQCPQHRRARFLENNQISCTSCLIRPNNKHCNSQKCGNCCQCSAHKKSKKRSTEKIEATK